MSAATVTSRGQITLPQAVRQALGVQAMADAVPAEAAARRAPAAPRRGRKAPGR